MLFFLVFKLFWISFILKITDDVFLGISFLLEFLCIKKESFFSLFLYKGLCNKLAVFFCFGDINCPYDKVDFSFFKKIEFKFDSSSLFEFLYNKLNVFLFSLLFDFSHKNSFFF